MKPRIKDLYCDNVMDKPTNYDWYSNLEEWDAWEAARCDECRKVVLSPGGENQHNEIADTDCEGYINTEGPMMSYYYPIKLRGDHPEDAAMKIADLPLCIVTFRDDEDSDYLALTGGGMDLSWEICEAYMRLGQLPPLHFCSLPGMADRGKSARDKWIIAGCRASAKTARNWAQSTLRDLANLKARNS